MIVLAGANKRMLRGMSLAVSLASLVLMSPVVATLALTCLQHWLVARRGKAEPRVPALALLAPPVALADLDTAGAALAVGPRAGAPLGECAEAA